MGSPNNFTTNKTNTLKRTSMLRNKNSEEN